METFIFDRYQLPFWADPIQIQSKNLLNGKNFKGIIGGIVGNTESETKYRRRWFQCVYLALKKIEGTRQNLARLADVLGEIRRQLSSLQRQAKKAEKFREYRDELSDNVFS